MSTPVEYDREAITRALTVLAFQNGNLNRTKRKLQEMGWPAPTVQTLKAWSERHADIYEDAKSRHMEMFASEADEVVRDSVTFMQQATRRLIENVDEMELKDLSNAMRNSSVAMGVVFDKSQMAKGQPTARIEINDAAAILRELNELNFERFRGELRAGLAELRVELAQIETRLTKRMFAFWIAQSATTAGLVLGVMKLVGH